MDFEQRAKDLFEQAVDLPAAERAAWLAQHCPGDDLRARVDALLRGHALVDETSFLARMAGALSTGEEEDMPERLGDFRLIRELGRGGMGVVYLARDEALNRLVAIKRLTVSGRLASEGLRRFQTEARALARLHHPAVVPIYHVGDAGGEPFLIMEWVDGETLADRLAREQSEGAQRVDPERLGQLAELLATVADGLEHAHQKEIIHRDVKPSNVLIDSEGRARLTDFGVARVLDEATQTSTGNLTGTYRYMSPEQAEAAGARIDRRSDVFSLGVVLYEAITLRRPFDGETAAIVLQAVRFHDPAPLRTVEPQVPKDLETICLKALEKDPAQRYQRAGHLAADLRSFAAGDPILARPPSLPRRVAKCVHQYRAAAALLTVVILGGGLALAWSAWARLERQRTCRVLVHCAEQGVVVSAMREGPDALDASEEPSLLAWSVGSPMTCAPGLYRISAVAADGRFVETSVYLATGNLDVEMTLSPQETGDLTTGMVRVEAATHTLGEVGEGSAYHALREVALPAFWIDAFEVSNGDYLEYTESTGAPVPHWWPVPLDEQTARLPVVGLMRSEATGYARWAGKRLPTLDEWEAAARMGDGRRLPWSGITPLGALPMIPPLLLRTEAAWVAAYRVAAADVGSRPDLASPSGLYHMMSNVSELCLEIAFEKQAVTYKGTHLSNTDQSWDAVVVGLGLDAPSYTRGFRCVRSESPFTTEE